MKKLRLGLDIGTNSVGYALLDENNKIIKKNGHAFWGVRLFEEASTAADRRSARTNRRRLARRKFRTQIIRDLFAKEINAIDPTFFERLDDSFYVKEDKSYPVQGDKCYNLFISKDYSDKDFFKEYPTIYHLRKALVEEDKKFDIRMVYLACVHIVKYRGNFLFNGDFNIEEHSIVKEFFDEFNAMLIDLKSEFEQNDEDGDTTDYWFDTINTENEEFFDTLKKILTDTVGISNRKKELLELFKTDKKSIYSEFVIPLLAGTKVNVSSISAVKEYKYDKCEITMDSEDIEGLVNNAQSTVKELYKVFDMTSKLKSVYDFYFVGKILKDSKSISEAMVKIYDEHNADLMKLKNFFKLYAKDKYKEVFRDKGKNNYAGYVGFNSVNNETTRFMHVKRDDFYTFLKKELDTIKCPEAEEEKQYFISKMDNNSFLLRQNSNQNGAFPKQLHFKELHKILENQSKYYPFLNEISDGFTTKEKVEKTFNYKIEYYVGPLNTKSEHAWVKRNSYEKIYPWNIDSIVDKDKSAEEFIRRMQNKCTYLDGEYCLPKASIVFSEYNCLAYLNKITINGSLMSTDVKEKIFKEIFLTKKQPTNKDICDYFKKNYGDALTTTRKELPDVTCNMSSYIQMKDIFGEEYIKNNLDTIERIIQDITIFEDKYVLVNRLKNEYKLDDSIIKQIKGLTFKGYARISNKLINGLILSNEETGEVYGTVLEIMRATNLNLQEILYDSKYRLVDIIDSQNKKYNGDKETHDLNTYIEDNVAVSPAFRRAIIQSYTIIEEIEKIFGRPIDEYYVECTRTNQAKKGKTKSRYDKVKELYQACEDTSKEYDLKRLNKELEDHKDSLKSDLLYLYFTQLGKCMYSLEPIDLDDLISNNRRYDIDHIYPQSIIKDDSLSNRVLVNKERNAEKTDKFLFETKNVLNPEAFKFHKLLLEHGLISKEKYKRLTQRQLSESELDGFVNRQLVSTNQSVTGLIKVLKEYHNVDPKNIIYSKGENVSDFRKEFDLVKSRTANNYHHAHDAYLNVIVGGVLDKYYKSKGLRFFKDYDRLKSEGYSINPIRIFAGSSKHPENNKIVKDASENVIWDRDRDVARINHDLYERFDITETHRTYNSSELYKKTKILPKGQGTVSMQTTTPRKDIDKYGGINSASYNRYVIVECKNKKGTEVILEAIPKLVCGNPKTLENDIKLYLNCLYIDKKGKPLYNEIEIKNYNVKSNSIVEYENKKFVIASKTNDAYNLKNIIDRNFSKYSLKVIKKIDKFINLKTDKDLSDVENKLVISPARNNETKEISITNEELRNLLAEIMNIYSKNIYSYSPITKLLDIIDLDKKYDFKTLFTLCNELLKILKTNERKLCDLKIINQSPNYGTLLISKKLKPGMKFIAESVTGYYKKVLYEVK